MTEPESNAPELTPAQDEAVRRQLAAARHTDPLPGDVSERLDRVLVGLAEERLPDRRPAPVADLAAHRRRRAVQMLVAAAAVVVAGVGIAQFTGGVVTNSADDSGAASDFSGRGAEVQGPESPEANSTKVDSPAPSGDGVTTDLSKLPVIRPDHFAVDVADSTRVQAYTASNQAKGLWAVCPVATDAERTLAVRYEGSLAALVYHAPADDVQRVDLYRCDPDGTDPLLRSVVIPGP